MRTITRKWINKSGKLVSRTYTYNPYVKKVGRAKRSRLLVGKNGKIGVNNKKNLQRYIDEIKASDASESAKITLISDIKAEVADSKRMHKSLTIRSAESKIAMTKQEKFIINLGYDPEQLSSELGVDIEDLLMTSNWDKDVLTVGNKSWKFTFNYEGDAYVSQ